VTFPINSILDDFNRANGGLGILWTTGWGDSALTIISNTVASSVAGFGGGYWNSAQFGNDYEVYATVSTIGSAAQRIFLNASHNPGTGSFDGYSLAVNSPGAGNWDLRRVVVGAATSLITGTQSLSNGDSVGLERLGPNLTAYYKASGGSWASVFTTTDTRWTEPGYIGFEVENNVHRIDDFGGGTIGSTVAWITA
jgi:hypothetical protein